MEKERIAQNLVIKYLESCLESDPSQAEELGISIDCLKNIWGIENPNVSYSLLDIIPKPSYDTEKADALKLEGNKLLGEGRIEEAIEKYNAAISVDPTQSTYYCNRAAAYSKLGQYQKTIEDCEKAIKINPNYANAYSRLGFAHYKMNEIEKAREVYKKGLEACPDNKNLRDNLDSLGPEVAEEKEAPTGGNGMPGMDFLSGLASNPMFAKFASKLNSPEVLALLQEPEMQELYQTIQANPTAIMSYLGDPRMQRLMGILLNSNN